VIQYLAKRIVQAPLILLTLATLSFVLMRFAPGGPFSDERDLEPVAQEAVEKRYHIDKPLPAQYGLWLRNMLRGDLGESTTSRGQSVNAIIWRNLAPSLALGVLAMSVALGLGLSTGLIAAVNQQGPLDYGTIGLAVLGISLPTFVIGPLLQLVTARWLGWTDLPIGGYQGLREMKYLILPALTLGLPFAARISRLTRAGMLEVLSSDFVRTAKAKGLPMHVIVRRHCLRGGLLPVISFLGPAATMMATGSLVVEFIFLIPGLGKEFIESALNRDYNLVMGTVMLYGLFIVVFNLIADVAYAALDPRVRYT
jgi:oligopeptide transport system permease protein